jgi:hypothetical protein
MLTVAPIFSAVLWRIRVKYVNSRAASIGECSKRRELKLGQHKPTQSYFCFESCPITFSKLGTFQHTTGIRVVDLGAKEQFCERFTIRFLSCHLSAVVCLLSGRVVQNTCTYFCLRQSRSMAAMLNSYRGNPDVRRQNLFTLWHRTVL